MSNQGKTVVITGGSSGIGLETARLFSKKGYRVYELSRRNCENEGITHIGCDVSDRESVCNAVARIVDEAGRIYILVNNAGYGISGPVEMCTIESTKKMFDVNLFGAFEMVKAVIPLMRKQQSGRIILVSSLAAEFSLPFQVAYSASKAALASLSDGLRAELKPFGIEVTCLMPGDVNTAFARDEFISAANIYKRLPHALETIRQTESEGLTAGQVAADIVSIAEKRSMGVRYVSGTSYRIFRFIKRFLPDRLTNWILYKMY